MDYLWTPWRYAYVSGATKEKGCIFCAAPKETDEKARIVYRGTHCYIILNTFPYTNGHVMIVPYEHVADLAAAEPETLAEMMALAQRVQTALRKTYTPEGYNIGMNLGRAAGAGVTRHIHLHVLPRWAGDANFMTVTGETRVEPEDLDTTFDRLSKALS